VRAPLQPDLFRRQQERERRRNEDKIVEIEAELRRETLGDRPAYLIFDGMRLAWVPKSLVEHDPHEGTFAMPCWLAKDKELI